MDLEIVAGECTISATAYNRTVTVRLDEIKKSDLDIKEVAECVNIETYIDAIGEDALKDHIKKYYDWFN